MPSHGLLYFVFLGLVWMGHWPFRNSPTARCMWFLIASVVFYSAWNVNHLGLLVVVTIVSFCGGLAIDQYRMESLNSPACRSHEFPRSSAVVVWVPVLICLAPLIYFKYGNFLQDLGKLAVLSMIRIDSIRLALEKCCDLDFGSVEQSVQPDDSTNLLLPIGISFYTFQAIGYLIDVRRRHIPAERNLLRHAVFLAFFPQLVAGPIEQARKLSPQLWRRANIRARDLTEGLHLMGIGVFKKIVLADNAAQTVLVTLSQPTSAIGVYCGALALMGQLYFDIAAYTDIARGSARLFGVELRSNLRAPFLEKTCSGFWSAWHLSVTQWFRSYVYRPLFMRKRKIGSHGPILLITMIATGLWHGASWNFVLFGGIHGLWVWSEIIAKRFKRGRITSMPDRSSEWMNRLQWLVFIHLLSWSGTLFFAKDLEHEWAILRMLFQGSWNLSSISYSDIIVTTSVWIVALWYQRYERNSDCPLPILRWSKYTRAVTYFIAVFLVIFVGNFDSNDFVYMRF